MRGRVIRKNFVSECNRMIEEMSLSAGDHSGGMCECHCKEPREAEDKLDEHGICEFCRDDQAAMQEKGFQEAVGRGSPHRRRKASGVTAVVQAT